MNKSTHFPLQPFNLAYDFTDDINKDPDLSVSSGTYPAKPSLRFRSVKNGCFLLKRPLPILVWGKIVLLNSPRKMAASLLYSWAIQNASNGKSLRSFWMSSTPSDTI